MCIAYVMYYKLILDNICSLSLGYNFIISTIKRFIKQATKHEYMCINKKYFKLVTIIVYAFIYCCFYYKNKFSVILPCVNSFKQPVSKIDSFFF